MRFMVAIFGGNLTAIRGALIVGSTQHTDSIADLPPDARQAGELNLLPGSP
jgi:hypothetical protein